MRFKPGHPQLHAIKFLHHDKFLAPRQFVPPLLTAFARGKCNTAPVPIYQISAPGAIPGHLETLYRDPRHSLRSHGAGAPARNKICAMRAKSTPPRVLGDTTSLYCRAIMRNRQQDRHIG
jgi:hypothetical protein